MSERRHANVVNVDEAKPMETAKGTFASRRVRLGAEAGAHALGCSHYEVAPGKTAFPFHFHNAHRRSDLHPRRHGTARLGADSIAVRAGDYVAIRPERDTPHALTNTGRRRSATSRSRAPRRRSPSTSSPTPTRRRSRSPPASTQEEPPRARPLQVHQGGQPSVGYYDDEPLAKE